MWNFPGKNIPNFFSENLSFKKSMSFKKSILIFGTCILDFKLSDVDVELTVLFLDRFWFEEPVSTSLTNIFCKDLLTIIFYVFIVSFGIAARGRVVFAVLLSCETACGWYEGFKFFPFLIYACKFNMLWPVTVFY